MDFFGSGHYWTGRIAMKNGVVHEVGAEDIVNGIRRPIKPILKKYGGD
jgi:hypothetical protein